VNNHDVEAIGLVRAIHKLLFVFGLSRRTHRHLHPGLFAGARHLRLICKERAVTGRHSDC
jgi:hypothetical protein